MLAGRLHYKEDLIRGLPAGEGRAFPGDAALALALFRARGPQGLARLEGEFSLVVCDPAARRLYLLRDPMGSWPLYWAASGRKLLAGTSLLDLARRLGDTRVNLDHLGRFLMWPFPGVEMGREDTALEPICRVPAGRLLRLGAAGGPVALHEHEWPSTTEDLALDEDAAGRQFLELFRASVRQRLEPGSTAAHLSGGMDSSAVVCVARDLMGVDAEARPLHTLSLVYRMPSLAGEEPYIRLVLDQGGPVASHYVDGDQLLGFDWFDSGVPEHDEPFLGLHQIAPEVQLVQRADEVGATTVLTGEGAELVAEGQGFVLADLIRGGRWATALRLARAQARAIGGSPWPSLYRQGLAPLVPGCLRDGAGTLWRRGRARWPHVGQASIPPWVRDGFAREHRLWAKGREALGRFHRAPYEESACRALASVSSGTWFGWHLANPRGLQVARPFLEPRLIAFSLSLPHRLRLKPGVAKPLLQSSMKGILPEPIRTRLWKRHFNDPYRLGLTRRLGAIEAMVERSSIADLDLIDRPELLNALRQVASGLGKTTAGFRINSTLALIAWYDQLGPALARPADEPAELVRWAGERDADRSFYVNNS
jgi:asparagine synthase (glutamine-hydrolysing)